MNINRYLTSKNFLNNIKFFLYLLYLLIVISRLNLFIFTLCRNALMFNNEHMADVHFIVGPPGESERVPAHKVSPHTSHFGCLLNRTHLIQTISLSVDLKYVSEKEDFPGNALKLDETLTDCLFCFSQYVLAVGSSVFCAMFYGDLAEGDSDIHIPDVEPAAFLILLK